MAEDALRAANLAFAAAHPGESAARQPVHTVYGGAQLFAADTAVKIAALARTALDAHGRDPATLGAALGWTPGDPLAARVHAKVAERLAGASVEDFRIDFEDGYGNRPDAVEDGHAVSVAGAVAEGMKRGTLPPVIGIRVKPLNEELRARSLRTLELFVTALVERAGRLPDGFVLTLPKITVVEQVAHFAATLGRLERQIGLADGLLRFELMLETPQIIIAADGHCLLPALVAAGEGRVSAAHFGTYDYTAYLGITAAEQRMRHPACDFAKQVMQVALAGTGIQLSDGSTAVLPVGDRASVHRAWKLHYDDVMHSLRGGFYQGWDLHPAQLVTRYAAVYAFFLAGAEAAAARLRNFIEKAAQATLVGSDFDDAATGQGLLNYFLRGIGCSAVTEEEVERATGLTHAELATRSFVNIMRGRS